MNKNLMDCLQNPIKCKILLSVRAEGQTTAKQLAEANKTIPQATLYRHLGKMTNDGILKVVQENRIRGVVEKVYALAEELAVKPTVLAQLSGEAYMSLFTEYVMNIMGEFSAYTSGEGIDIANDGSGFSVIPIYATKEELQEIGSKIVAALTPFMQNEPSPERRYHTVSLIVTPPKNIE